LHIICAYQIYQHLQQCSSSFKSFYTSFICFKSITLGTISQNNGADVPLSNKHTSNHSFFPFGGLSLKRDLFSFTYLLRFVVRLQVIFVVQLVQLKRRLVSSNMLFDFLCYKNTELSTYFGRVAANIP